MTIALEQLHDGSPTDRNFQKLTALVLDTGGRSVGVRFGTQVVSPAGSVTANATVTHGLGKTPTSIQVSAKDASGLVNVTYSAEDATTFVINMAYVDGTARTASIIVSWEVKG